MSDEFVGPYDPGARHEFDPNGGYSVESPPEVLPGDMISFVLPDGSGAGEKRPGVVVKIWHAGCINAQVFTDWKNDGEAFGLRWVTSIVYDPDPTQLGHWHLLA